jgi:hypothetical protein
MLLLPYGLLCFALPSYKVDLDLCENFVTSFNASCSGDDGEILKESDIDFLYSDLDNRELEPLQRKFKQSKSPDSLEGKVNIPTSQDRTQGSNLMWDDNVLNSIIHHQLLMMILLVLLLICITTAICCL